MTFKSKILNADFIATMIIAAAFTGALVQARAWPMEASLFPMVVGVSGLALALLQIITHVGGRTEKVDEPEEQPSQGVGVRRAEIRAFGWILGLLVATILAGFQWGLPAVIFLYYRLESKQRLITSVVLAVVCWAVVYAWTSLLHLMLYAGLLSKLVPGQ